MKKDELVRMTTAAFLLALILLFGLTPLGMWDFGVVYITLLCIPVVIGTLTLGPGWGFILAVAFGTVSFATGMRAPSGLVTPILQASPLWVIVLCFVPRMIIPFTTWFTFKAVFMKKEDCKLVSIPAAVGSLTNTILYLGFILILYWIVGYHDEKILATLGTIVLAGGLPEAFVSAIIVPAVYIALKRAKLIRLPEENRFMTDKSQKIHNGGEE